MKEKNINAVLRKWKQVGRDRNGKIILELVSGAPIPGMNGRRTTMDALNEAVKAEAAAVDEKMQAKAEAEFEAHKREIGWYSQRCEPIMEKTTRTEKPTNRQEATKQQQQQTPIELGTAKPKIEPAEKIPSSVLNDIDFGCDLPANHPWRTERKSIFTCPPKEQEPRKEESHGQTHRYSVEASEGRRGWLMLTLDCGALVLVPRTVQKPKYLTVSEEGHNLIESRKSDSAWILDNNLIINIL